MAPVRFPAIANYLRLAGYVKVPGKRQYVSPTGETISRRQAEQRSGAIQAIFGEPSRERVTQYARPGKHATKEDFARAYKARNNDPRSISTIMRTDADFRYQWSEWYQKGKFRHLTPEQRRRKLRAGESVGWFTYDRSTRTWRYIR